MKNIIQKISLFILLFVFSITFGNQYVFAEDDGEIIKVEITGVQTIPCDSELSEVTQGCYILDVVATTGSVKGEKFKIDFSNSEMATVAQVMNQGYKIGQIYYADYYKKINGTGFVVLAEKDRVPMLLLFSGIFFFIVILFGGKKGFKSILSMSLSFLILIWVIADGIFANYNIIFLTFISSMLIIFLLFYLTHGFNKKTHSAVIGSIVSLSFTFVLTYIAINLTHLTGFAADESNYLIFMDQQLNIRDILFAGMIIGILGILDDVAITQSSTVFQMREINDKLTVHEVYKKALIVGKDHFGSMMNTLIIAYAGASFSLFLLIVKNTSDIFYMMNKEVIATEIVRMIVGGVGILITIPVTTFIASLMSKSK